MDPDLTRDEHEALAGHKGALVWFTGLSASGKTTLSRRVARKLHERKVRTRRLDGDIVREGLNSDLGFLPEHRQENVRRLAEVGRLLSEAGVVVLVAAIAPYEADRQFVRGRFDAGRYFEIFVDTSLATCESRDPKGLYVRARNGELRDFTGVSAPYEWPSDPELRAVGNGDLDAEAERVVAMLVDAGILPA
jgi:adenylylsulfate kinase